MLRFRVPVILAPKSKMTRMACWAHARRHVYEHQHYDATASALPLALINKIYDVERRAADMNVDERGVLRATETGMYLDRLREWLDGPVAASLLPPEQAGKYIQLYPQSVVSEASFESHSKASSWASPPDLATPQKNQPMLRVRLPSATLRELSERFGLSHPDSASDLIRRGAKRIEQSSEAIRQHKAIEKKLNPESRT